MAIYHVDPEIKRPKTPEKYDREKIDRLLKSARDPVYFCENFVKVQHPTRGVVPLRLYDYQKELIETCMKYPRVIALMGRQMGKTTAICSYLLWRFCFLKDQTILVLAQAERNAIELLSKIQFAYEELPNYIKPGIETWTKSTIAADNGSRIIARATSPRSIRSLSVSCLSGKERVKVRNDETGEIHELTLEELGSLLEHDDIS